MGKTADALVVERLTRLAERGFELAGWGAVTDNFWAAYNGWFAQSLTAISDVSGPTSPYSTRFNGICRHVGLTEARSGASMLEGLRDDVANGYLRRITDLAAAAVFSDFLEMAEHLLDSGYFIPAASLTGAVLEDGLRRIAAAHNVKVTSKDDLSSLNTKLAQAKVYNEVVRKSVALWTDIRNKADHGKFQELTATDVKLMHAGVQDFMASRLP